MNLVSLMLSEGLLMSKSKISCVLVKEDGLQ